MTVQPLDPKIIAEIEALDQSQLLIRRTTIISKGRPDELSDSDLQELVIVHNLLRRRSSGPPSATKKKGSTISLLPPKERLESLL